MKKIISIQAACRCEDCGHESWYFRCPFCKKKTNNSGTELYMEDVGYQFDISCYSCEKSINLIKTKRTIDGITICKLQLMENE